MPIPPAGFHMMKKVRDGAPQDGLAMREDPVTGDLLGVERCPDCVWDCVPAVESPCSEKVCGTDLDRPATVKLIVNFTGDPGRGNCSPGGPAVGCGFEASDGDYNYCDCLNGTYILPYTGGATAADACTYGQTTASPPWENGCSNQHSRIIGFSFAAMASAWDVEAVVDGGGNIKTTWQKTITTPTDCMNFSVQFVDADHQPGPPYQCNGTVSVST